MYLPAPFRCDDSQQQLLLMRQHPFATMVATLNGTLEAVPIPLLIDMSDGRCILHGHVARENPFTAAKSALAIFHGPHAYISSAWYQEADTVPTWNYITVHAAGSLTWITDINDERGWFERLTRTFDPTQDQRIWQQLSEAAFAQLRKKVAWFRMDVDHLEAKAKLGQNHSPERRARTIAALRAQGGAAEIAIAEAMAAVIPPPASSTDA